jgi:serine/threonine-protein kinase
MEIAPVRAASKVHSFRYMQELASGDRLDGFVITDTVARTAMASVFRARDTRDGTSVCVKVPHPACECDVVLHQRFVREERIARRIDHPNIVRALDAREQSRKYLVMEYLDGATLRTVLAEAPLAAARALGIAAQLLEALVYLHARDIVHRDIKPENVVLLSGDRVKLLDFGIALDRAARRLTWTGLSHAVGTPDYMAPEQVGGKRGDERSDVYSVGLVLYEMLTGELPYTAETPEGVLRQKANEEPRPPTFFISDLDPALSAVICRAIAPRPRDRFASAAALLAALRDPAGAGAREEGIAPPAVRPFVLRVAVAALLAALGSLTWISHRAAPPETPKAGAAPSAAPALPPPPDLRRNPRTGSEPPAIALGRAKLDLPRRESN